MIEYAARINKAERYGLSALLPRDRSTEAGAEVVQLVVGDKIAAVVVLLLGHLKKALRKHGITLEGC